MRPTRSSRCTHENLKKMKKGVRKKSVSVCNNGGQWSRGGTVWRKCRGGGRRGVGGRGRREG